MTQLYKKNGAVFIPAGITVEELYYNSIKAKELIDELSSSLSVVGECGEEECELLNRAEQFLKDSIE